MSVLVMAGAGLMLLLAVPMVLIAVPGLYYARRAARWLAPVVRGSMMDLAGQVLELGGRVARSGLPRTLTAGVTGCALMALPSLAAPVRDLDPDRLASAAAPADQRSAPRSRGCVLRHAVAAPGAATGRESGPRAAPGGNR